MVDETKIMGIFSAKGGVGKTTIVSNLGTALATSFNKNICLVDANVTASSLGLHFGLYYPSVSLNDIAKKRISIASALFVHPSGVRIIPGSISSDGNGVDIKNLRFLLKRLKGYDYIILDSPPCLSRETFNALGAVDQLVVVTTPDLPSATDAARMVRAAKKKGIPVLGIIVNRVKGAAYELTKNEIESLCDSKTIGAVPEDETIPKSIADGVPAVLYNPFSNCSKAVGRVAARLCGQDYKSPGVWEMLKNMLGFGRQGREKTAIETEKEKTGIDEEELKKYKEPELRGMLAETRGEILGEMREELVKTLRSSIRTAVKNTRTRGRRK